MAEGAICGASLGRWGKPMPLPTAPAGKMRCEISTHHLRKWLFPATEMYYQRWELTEDEMSQAINNYDMFSLDMPPRFLCEDCKRRITNEQT